LAVDISVEFLRQSLQCLQREHPQMPMAGVGLDFSAELALPPGLVSGPAVVFYPGSSIGNFNPTEALHLLSQARNVAAGGALLIGADLVKPVDVLEAAYDDALGITAAFNLNLLNHLNRLLGADFQLREWRHLAVFNAAESRIEMHLEARCRAPLRCGRAHPHRELVQVDARDLRGLAARGRVHADRSLDRRAGLVRGVAGLGLRDALHTVLHTALHTAQVRNPAGTPLRWASKKLR
jgi:uncharacterized SAM-dependent methyltransferase